MGVRERNSHRLHDLNRPVRHRKRRSGIFLFRLIGRRLPTATLSEEMIKPGHIFPRDRIIRVHLEHPTDFNQSPVVLPSCKERPGLLEVQELHRLKILLCSFPPGVAILFRGSRHFRSRDTVRLRFALPGGGRRHFRFRCVIRTLHFTHRALDQAGHRINQLHASTLTEFLGIEVLHEGLHLAFQRDDVDIGRAENKCLFEFRQRTVVVTGLGHVIGCPKPLFYQCLFNLIIHVSPSHQRWYFSLLR